VSQIVELKFALTKQELELRTRGKARQEHDALAMEVKHHVRRVTTDDLLDLYKVQFCEFQPAKPSEKELPG